MEAQIQSAWLQDGLTADAVELQHVLSAVRVGVFKHKLQQADMCNTMLNYTNVSGSWSRDCLTNRDVLRIYWVCNILRLDVRATIYNIAVRAFGERVTSIKYNTK